MSGIGLWHVVNGEKPSRLIGTSVPEEKLLEDWIESDPSLISPALHAVRRQVPLGRKLLDLLAVEAPGIWVVCELKKIELEREVLSQAIDYMARLAEMSLPDFRALVTDKSQYQTIETRELVQQALEREENGEGREIRIVLTGIGVRSELTRMVDLLAGSHGVPIQVCTLSAVMAPGGNGLILMRDTTDDVNPEIFAESQGSSYEDRLRSVARHFSEVGAEPWLTAILEVVKNNDHLYARPWKRALMIAPEQHHGRYLMYLTPRSGGVYASFGIDAVEEFFPSADLQKLETLAEKGLFTSEGDLLEWVRSINDALGAPDEPKEKTQATWNGKDWYVSFGEDEGGRDWQDAVKYGFIAAGGGDWYSRTLRKVPVGARVFVRIPRIGYVACGVTKSEAVRFTEAKFLQGLPLNGTYEYANGEPEYVVQVEWLTVIERSAALNEAGLFANENSACRLRDPKTIARVYDVFGISE